MKYRLFDTIIESELPLPMLSRCEGGPIGLTLKVTRGATNASFQSVHDWKDASGETLISCARRGSDYILRFHGLADFMLRIDAGVIELTPAPGSAEADWAHLLLDQVVPRFLCQRGRMVIHASGVQLPQGRVVAFVGNSGLGKSTLAAFLQEQGSELLCDDSMILEMSKGTVWAVPAYASLRLWPDSLDAIRRDRQGFSPMTQYSEKLQAAGGTQNPTMADRALPLHALFLLGKPNEATTIQVSAASGQDAAISIIEAMFNLDVRSRATLDRNFRSVGELSRHSLAVFHLQYPRRFACLAQVAEAIETAVAALD